MSGTSNEVRDVTESSRGLLTSAEGLLTVDAYLRSRTPVEGLFIWSPLLVPPDSALFPHPGNDGLLLIWISSFVTWRKFVEQLCRSFLPSLVDPCLGCLSQWITVI